MCGRYASARSTADLATLLGAADETGERLVEPDYNVAPTKDVPAAVVRDDRRRLVALRWGLVPSWARDPRIGNRLINARVETVAAKPAFRAAFARRRCLLPADGYYEWKPPAEGRPSAKNPKQPYYLHPADGGLLVMAGLYEIWKDAEGRPLWTSTVITTQAADEQGEIHDRAPLMVPPDLWERWLDPAVPGDELLGALPPAVGAAIAATPVSTLVNDVRHNGPELVVPGTV
ncbi:MAG TPA: SOS response-associated peptidase [Mycobacteriales bacterium]